jgi:predicted nuclease of predicted toxin-antitoxin system
MKFFADENVESLVVEALQAAGHDVATVPAEIAGIRDGDVLARSVMEQRILLTNDKDFAELAFLQRSAATGIILMRLPRSSSRDKADRLLEMVRTHANRLADAMTVVDERGVRRRPLPPLRLIKQRPGSAD